MDVATSNLAQAMARQADDTFKEADTALLGIVERVQHFDAIGVNAPGWGEVACDTLLDSTKGSSHVIRFFCAYALD